jgi:serine/threonine protein kinase
VTFGSHADSSVQELGGKLGKYQLIRRLATGGMAELFLARTTAIHGFEKIVVLKRILPQHAENDDFIRMFLAEARLAATLHHPNIVQVYDIGEDNGTYFFTMEYVQGVDLRKLVRSARKKSTALPLEHILHIIMGMAGGLNHAHEKVGLDGKPLGIVHRDVSPSNVLVTFDGGVKIVDFGIAKAATAQVATIAGTLKGKIPYMSPEQCRGEGVDRRSDIFSIGTLLWELTTGTRLFAGDNEFAILNRVAKGDVPTPSSIRPDYPPELEAIVMKALQADPEHRYGTALDLQIDLEDFSREARLPVSSARLGRFMKDLCAEEIAKIASQLSLEREEATTVPQPVLSATAIVSPAANDLASPPGSGPSSALGSPLMAESGTDLTPSELRGAPLMPTPGPVDYNSSVTEVPFESVPGKTKPGVVVALVAGLIAVVGLGAGGLYMFRGPDEGAPKAPPKVITAPAPVPYPDEQPDDDPPATVNMAPAAVDGSEDVQDAAGETDGGGAAPHEDDSPAGDGADEPEIEVDDSADDGDDGTSEPESAEEPGKSKRPKRPTSSKKPAKPTTTTPTTKKKQKWDPNVGMPGL